MKASGTPQTRKVILEKVSGKQPMEVHLRSIYQNGNSPFFMIRLNPGEPEVEIRRRLSEKGVSPREMDVIHFVGQGLTNDETARRLYISRYTVENHLKSIYRKLSVKNRAGLVRKLLDFPY